MKSKMLFVLITLIVNAVVHAQDFKPYKVKSGKITYDKLKYSTVSKYSNHNGVVTSYSKQVPHIDQQVVYYWDEYGDIAFEEVYQVSEFGGKLLPEKVKIAERFWVDENRYYFSFEKNTVSDDPYHLRIKCKQHFQYYQIIGSWIETLYMGTEKSGTKEILGKQADYYKIDAFQDIYTWEGLVLKDESFATRTNGERLHPNHTKIAIAIDTISEINKELFNPIWLKRETLYNSLNQQKIVELMDGRQELLIQAENNIDFKIKKNDILLFVTTKLATGKLQILNVDKNQLTIKYQLYNNNGFELDSRDSYKIKDSSFVNMDNITYKKSEKSEFDFMYKNETIIHKNNISFFLLKPSRSKKLAIPKYRRKY